MAKLNGWKRLGIIASVTWMFGAWIYTYNSEINNDSKLIASAHVTCDASLPDWRKDNNAYQAAFRQCDKQAEDSLALAISSAREEAAVAAIAPVPLGWGFTYLILLLVQWVRRGFIQGNI